MSMIGDGQADSSFASGAGDEFDRGTELKDVPEKYDSDEKRVKQARDEKPTLLTMPKSAAAKYVRKRWDRGEKYYRGRLAELKVNFLRYGGNPFVQIHPDRPDEVYMPAGMSAKIPPTINKLRRTVHRYQAQVTADEPILEGVPDSSSDLARDQAESASHVIRGEWYRLDLLNRLRRVVQSAAIFRSGFWFFEWDERAGGKVPAQKFFDIEGKGERELRYIDGNGDPVDNPEDAAEIWQGDICVKVLNPMNVRWLGGEYAHDADELLVGFMVPLGELYDKFPEARKAKVRDLIANTPRDGDKWLEDIRGQENQRRGLTQDGEEFEDMLGDAVPVDSSILDTSVFVLHYFKKTSRQYEDGVHIITAGNFPVYRGVLRYRLMPIAHFKFLDEINDPLGTGLIDLLKDPQELMDFVNGQILRFLQMMKRRYFVPMGSTVSQRDLLSPTRSVISYNPQAGKPEPEQIANIPQSMVEWTDRFSQAYDDESGIHATMQGKHVPGVSSGRHAEALRQGDETILGLTRGQMARGLETAGRIIIEMVKKEWTTERKVRYFDNREYMDIALSGMDLGTTSQVKLRKGTLLMLTPAQKTETLYAYAQMGIIPPDELRRLAPVFDAAGVSLTEDVHYQRARRQNQKFFNGPSEELVLARDTYMGTQEQLVGLQQQAMETQDEGLMAQMQQVAQEAEQEWMEAQMNMGFKSMEFEMSHPAIANIHATEHFKALASDRVAGMEEWWVQLFEQHALQEWQAANPAPPPEEGAGQAPYVDTVGGSAPPPPQPI
jgi:hypothetical protein